jgi:hypothetical protein
VSDKKVSIKPQGLSLNFYHLARSQHDSFLTMFCFFETHGQISYLLNHREALVRCRIFIFSEK